MADIGGTNVRFARSSAEKALFDHRNYPVNLHRGFADALTAFLNETGGVEGCRDAAIGAAGAVFDGAVKITNTPWRINETDVSRQLAGVPIRIANDLEAVALALPYLLDADVQAIGDVPRQRSKTRTMLAVNIGTGFGAAAVIPFENSFITCPSEAGHMSLGFVDRAELDVLAGLESVESLLSGRGLTHLYKRLRERSFAGEERYGDGNCSRPVARNAAEIFETCPADPAACEAVRHFVTVLGRISGDLALASAAWGGVFFCGGVATGWKSGAGATLLRESFENKGAMRERMEQIFTGVITRDDVSLYGLSHLAIRA